MVATQEKLVIGVFGTASVGKSSTIRCVLEKLRAQFPDASWEPFHNPRSTEGDISGILAIGKIKIGIESQGDPNSRLFDTLKKFVEAGCVIIICTCRTRGATTEAVQRLESDGYAVCWKRKNWVPTPQKHQEIDRLADEVVQAIEGMLE